MSLSYFHRCLPFTLFSPSRCFFSIQLHPPPLSPLLVQLILCFRRFPLLFSLWLSHANVSLSRLEHSLSYFLCLLGCMLSCARTTKTINIYIYICCEVIIWAKFGHFRCYCLGQVGVIIWAKLFLAYKNSGFKRFLAHTVIILCFFLCPIMWQLSKNSLFQKEGAKKWVFQISVFKVNFWKVLFF